MPVTIATLCKTLAAVDAGEGAQTLMSSYMVHYVTHLCKSLAAGRAFKNLVFPTSLLIHDLHLSVAFFFSNVALVRHFFHFVYWFARRLHLLTANLSCFILRRRIIVAGIAVFHRLLF